MPKSFPSLPAVDRALKEVRGAFFCRGGDGPLIDKDPFTPEELEMARNFDVSEELRKARERRAAAGLS
jgi:hypothetical protein